MHADICSNEREMGREREVSERAERGQVVESERERDILGRERENPEREREWP